MSVTTYPIDSHWWGCAAALEDQVRSLLPAGWRVRQAKDLADILDQQQATNCVHVVPLGTGDVNHTRGSRRCQITQRWAVVIAVSAAGDTTGERQREQAGQMIPTLLRGLMGWTPGEGWAPCRLVRPPGADVVFESFAYYPFAVEFDAELHHSAGL